MSAVGRRRGAQRLPPEALVTPSTFMHASSRGRLIIPRHIEVIENAVLEAIVEGDVMMTIEAPVRTGKSFFIDWHLPAWYVGTFPHRHVGLASHEAAFASGWGAKARDSLIEFGSSFGVAVASDNRSRAEWEIAGHGGGMSSVGIKGGGITGRGFHLFILDDLLKNAADADSPAIRDAQWDFLRGTAMTRLEPRTGDEPGGVLIVTMARWHEDDLIGRIHRELPGQFRRVRLPAIAEAPSVEFPDADLLGRAEGEPLWPDRFPVENLKRRRALSGEYFFNALYQQRPGSAVGTVFHRDWWRRWSTLPESFDQMAWSWDLAFKGTDDSDYVVGQCWGQSGADFFLVELLRGQWDYPTTKDQLVAAVSDPRYSEAASQVFIESAANGPAIIDDLRHTVGGLIAVTGGRDSKLSRARSIMGYVESGNVYLPEHADWVEEFIDEAARFPKGAHDDQVDACSQAIREMLERGGGSVWAPTGEI